MEAAIVRRFRSYRHQGLTGIIEMLHDAILAAGAGILLWAAISDVASLRIPNVVPLALLILYPFHLLTAGTNADHLVQVGWAVGLALAVFAAGAFMFARGWMGGGDVKLVSVLALWAGPSHILDFLFVMSIAGGLLSLLIMLRVPAFVASRALVPLRALLPIPAIALERVGNRTVPYGVAIATGGLVVVSQLAGPVLP